MNQSLQDRAKQICKWANDNSKPFFDYVVAQLQLTYIEGKQSGSNAAFDAIEKRMALSSSRTAPKAKKAASVPKSKKAA